MAEGSKAEERACSTLLHRPILRVPKATLDSGGPLSGDFWSRIRLWKAVAKQITGSRCQPA